jgi:hypothetical protein
MPMEIVRQLPYNHPYRWDGTLFGGPRLWRPTELAGSLALWLDAEDSSTITLNGANVSQWADKSGNGRNATQATAAAQPAYTASGLNGKPVLTFDGANDTLSYNGTFLANTDYTVTAVHYRSNPKDHNWFFGGSTQGVNQNFVMGYESPNTKFRWGQFGNDVDTLGQTYVAGLPSTAIARQSQTEGKSTFINGVAGGVSANTQNLISYAGANIGALLGGFFAGGMAEIVMTTSALSTSDRQKLEGYLAWKWGLESNLPSNHPYKLLPPTV